jgi:VCBS repeat protein
LVTAFGRRSFLLAGTLALSGLAGVSGAPSPAQAPAAANPSPEEAMARKVCGTCHAFPPPESVPRDRWENTVIEMTALTLAGIGAPKDGPPPTLDFDPATIARFYKARAPEHLAAPDAWPEPGANPARFARHGFRPAGDTAATVANVRFADLDGDGRLQVVASDMRAGLVVAADPLRPGPMRILGKVPNPCHAEAVDLDRDGLTDLVVANLGAVPPGDYLKGSVVWLQRRKDGGYEVQTIASGLPRVADVQPVDADRDGDLDLLVAAFGWREVGGVLLLENRTAAGGAPVFVKKEIDSRPGAIHVPVTDLNADGKVDFVALFAQHYESVVAFVGDGAGGFRPQTVYAAPHPAWGSSGLALLDFDGDKDLDVLVTNGDMLDDFLLKPYHGMRWLENVGGLSFREHELANLPGVHRALGTDLDGDGDLDVVAGAFVQFKTPEGKERDARAAEQARMPSLVWLEQVAAGRFERRTLEQGGHHVSLDIADYDRDGDPDIAVGHFATAGGPWVEVWENLTKKR